MKKLNRKGFTLVELMAVIVILAVLIGIAVPSALAISHKVKLRMYNTKVEMILSSAKLYGQDNNDVSGEVTVGEIADNGYIKFDNIKSASDSSICESAGNNDVKNCVENPVDSAKMNDWKVKITRANRRVKACIVKTDGTWTSSDASDESVCK